MNNLEKRLKENYPDENIEVLHFTIMKEPATIRCKDCGTEYTLQRAESFYKRKVLCMKCKNNGSGGRLEQDDFQKSLKKYFPKENLLALDFKNTKTRCSIKCLDCGTVYKDVLPRSILYSDKPSFCKKCHPNKEDMMEQTRLKFKEWINHQTLFKDFSDCSKARSDTKIASYCIKCGRKTEKTIYKYMNEERGCAYCNKRVLKTKEEYEKELPDDYEVLEYHGMEHQAKFRHKLCGFIYNKNARNYPCPHCCKKETKGESQIRFLLESWNIKYRQEEMRLIEGHKLRFDFYLPEYDIYLEWQGEQHFHIVNYFGGKEQFQKQQEYDNLKRKYYKTKLIELPYYLSKEEIKNILKNSLCL